MASRLIDLVDEKDLMKLGMKREDVKAMMCPMEFGFGMWEYCDPDDDSGDTCRQCWEREVGCYFIREVGYRRH